MKALCVLAVALFAAMTARPACAADPIKIGVIYPLTGNAASAGSSAKDAVELGADIVNTAHPELQGLPLAATAGLPNLGGAARQPATARHCAGGHASIALAVTTCTPRRCHDRSCARPRAGTTRPSAFVPADAPSSCS